MNSAPPGALHEDPCTVEGVGIVTLEEPIEDRDGVFVAFSTAQGTGKQDPTRSRAVTLAGSYMDVLQLVYRLLHQPLPNRGCELPIPACICADGLGPGYLVVLVDNLIQLAELPLGKKRDRLARVDGRSVATRWCGAMNLGTTSA